MDEDEFLDDGSSSLGGSSSGGDYVACEWDSSLSSSPPVALTRESLSHVIRSYINDAWSLLSGQYEVASALWRRQDVVCCFPTSAGKTLIMMLGPLLDYHHKVSGVWIVCQPLEALRRTTVDKMKAEYFARTDVNVVLLGDAVGDVDDLLVGVSVIFCSPEQLSFVYQTFSKGAAIVHGLLVDEVHLRFAWEFRDYRSCDKFSTIFPEAVIGLFSATLGRGHADELVRLMAMRNVAFFTEREFPPLLLMKAARWDQFCIRTISMETDLLVAKIVAMFAKLPPKTSIIIFANSYSKLALLAEPLGRNILRPFSPRLYCSVFAKEHKEKTCDLLNSGHCRLVGATCALGAGVDLLNVAAIVFYGCPKSFADVTQGMGRAGRGADKPLVEIVFAADASSKSKADNHVRLLVGYCTKLRSNKMVSCSLCDAERACPTVHGASDTYKICFDFEGIHCQRRERHACKRTMCKVFDGLLSTESLYDGHLDCGVCDSCLGYSRPAFQEHNLVKYKGKLSVVVGHTSSERCRVREVESLENHTVASISLSLVSSGRHPFPALVKHNHLKGKQRLLLKGLLHKRLLAFARLNFCLLSCVPSDAVLSTLAKLLPADFALRCPVKFESSETMMVWFECAQHEAERASDDDDENLDNDEEENGEEADDVMEEEERDQQQQEMEAEGSEGDNSDDGAFGTQAMEIDRNIPEFVVDPSLKAYMATFLGPLRAQVAASSATGQAELNKRKSSENLIITQTAPLSADTRLHKRRTSLSSRK